MRRHLHDRVRGGEAHVALEQEGSHTDFRHFSALPRHRRRVRHRRRRRDQSDIPPVSVGSAAGPRGEVLCKLDFFLSIINSTSTCNLMPSTANACL